MRDPPLYWLDRQPGSTFQEQTDFSKKKNSRTCMKCQVAYAKTSQQLMGELPTSRAHPSRPFSTTGLDFTGLFYIKEGSIRKPYQFKAYVCIYICLGPSLLLSVASQHCMESQTIFIPTMGPILSWLTRNCQHLVNCSSHLPPKNLSIICPSARGSSGISHPAGPPC